MTVVRLICITGLLALLTGCEPGEGAFGVPTSGAEREKYERHKANRQSYMFQGGR